MTVDDYPERVRFETPRGDTALGTVERADWQTTVAGMERVFVVSPVDEPRVTFRVGESEVTPVR